MYFVQHYSTSPYNNRGSFASYAMPISPATTAPRSAPLVLPFLSFPAPPCSHRDIVCRPPLAHSSWRHHHHHHERQQHQPPSRERSSRWENGDGGDADPRHLRGTPLSTVGDDLVDGSSGNRGDGTGRRRSRHGDSGSSSSNSRSEVGARDDGGNAGDGDGDGSVPRPWELNPSSSRATSRWESDRRRLNRRDGGGGGGGAAAAAAAAAEEGLEEAYRTRATAAMLLSVAEKRVEEANGEGGVSRTGEDCPRGRDERCGDEGGRRPSSLSPSEASKAAGRGRKRFRRDLDEGGEGMIGCGSLASSNGGDGGGGGGGGSTRSAPEHGRDNQNPPP